MMQKSRSVVESIKHQGAHALLAAVFEFLRRNGIDEKEIGRLARTQLRSRKFTYHSKQFVKVTKAYEDMGTLLATWFGNPRFLDDKGVPLPLTVGTGQRSMRTLINSARVPLSTETAVQLLRQSSSVKFDPKLGIVPLRRVFVLRDFEIPRAALVIGRFLETLNRNSSPHLEDASLLLERSCHVSDVDLHMLSPVLRDIKSRGSAFIDSIDGEIEDYRYRKQTARRPGDLGVLIFAWTRSSIRRRAKPRKRKST